LVSVVLAVICLGAVAAHTRLITSSVKVGWNDSGNLLAEDKAELRQLKDPESLRVAAETFASMNDGLTKAFAQYIVYFYATLAALGLALAVIGYLSRSASNNRWRGP
jgi:hypothetical protein